MEAHFSVSLKADIKKIDRHSKWALRNLNWMEESSGDIMHVIWNWDHNQCAPNKDSKTGKLVMHA